MFASFCRELQSTHDDGPIILNQQVNDALSLLERTVKPGHDSGQRDSTLGSALTNYFIEEFLIDELSGQRRSFDFLRGAG